MRRYPKRGGQFAIIWVDLLYEDSVPQSAKILYGEIYRLSDADGYCDASNRDFMELLGCSENTVRNLLKALVNVGQIRIESQPRRAGTGGTERRIFCARRLAPPDDKRVPPEKWGYPEKPGEGTPKKLEGVPTEICGGTYSSNYNNSPPTPQRGRRVRTKKEPREAPDWMPERFAAFWAYYPRKEDKQRAMNAWDKLQPSDELIAVIARALRRQKASADWKRGVGIPYASTYLNNSRWTDAPLPLPAPPTEPPKEVFGWQ